MSILSDTDLKKVVRFDENQWQEQENILIKHGEDDYFTAMGYDLRVGGFYKTLVEKPNLRPIEKDAIIKPGEIALVGTYEILRMPKDGSISALILSKVSIVAKGLSNISTKVDPGWQDGELLIPIQNFSKNEIRLHYKQPFCTIVFLSNISPSKEQYKPGQSRTKFVKLLAETRRRTLFKKVLIESTPVWVIILAFGIGWYFPQVSPNVAALTGAVISPFIKYMIEVIFEQE